MKNNIQVVVNLKSGVGLEIEKIYLKNDGGEITLDKAQYLEILSVMNGKRERAYSEESDGYNPKSATFWN